MWHCGPLAVLSKAQIELEHVQLASDRISQRVETTGRLLHMQHPAAGEELGGPSRVDRFETLSNVLKRRVTLTLAQPAAASGPVLIRPSIVEKPFFDDHAKKLSFPYVMQRIAGLPSRSRRRRTGRSGSTPWSTTYTTRRSETYSRSQNRTTDAGGSLPTHSSSSVRRRSNSSISTLTTSKP